MSGVLFGTETEYALAVLDADGKRTEPDPAIESLFRHLRKQVANVNNGYDVFAGNGARFYVDVGNHVETATPECTTPEQVVRFSRANDRILVRAAEAVGNTFGRLIIWKANVDPVADVSWGSHESYLHRAQLTNFVEPLITHFATRQIYTGAGGFNSRGLDAPEFAVAPRAFYLTQSVSGSTTRDRGIFNTREEALADGGYRRLHVIAGESLWSESADYLRVGVTALLVRLIDVGLQPCAGLSIDEPVSAMQTVAGDVELTRTIAMKDGAPLTALVIQRRLHERVSAEVGGDHLPEWAGAVCEMWGRVLDALADDPTSMVGVLDWPTRLAVLQRTADRLGVAWPTAGSSATSSADSPGDSPADNGCGAPVTPEVARLLETDARFNRLTPDDGIFRQLDGDGVLAHRVTSDAAVELAMAEPPSTSRAHARSECIRQVAARNHVGTVNWQYIVDHDSGQSVRLSDPFATEPGPWRNLEKRKRGGSDEHSEDSGIVFRPGWRL